MIYTAEQLRRVNGFGTQFWGWGREDDNMRERLDRAGGHVLFLFGLFFFVRAAGTGFYFLCGQVGTGCSFLCCSFLCGQLGSC